MNGRAQGARVSLALLALAFSACNGEQVRPVPALSFRLEPSEIDLGSFEVGRRSPPQLITIENSGQLPLELELELEGPGADSYVLAPPRVRLGTRSQADVSLYFVPADVGAREATVVARSIIRGLEPQTLAVTGLGLEPQTLVSVFPSTLSFGDVLIGTRHPQSIVVTSEVDTPTTVELSLDDNLHLCRASGSPDGSTFCLADTEARLGPDLRFELDARRSAVFAVELAPELADVVERGRLSIRGCPQCPRQTVDLLGRGVSSGLVCTSTVVDFANTAPQTCRDREIICLNTAQAPLSLLGWGPPPARPLPPAFELSPSEGPVELERGDEVRIAVRYCPRRPGEDEGAIEIRPGPQRPDSVPWKVSLLGHSEPASLSIAPSERDLGQLSVIAPARFDLAINNTGAIERHLLGARVEDAEGLEISVPDLGSLIPAASSRTISVSVRATQLGAIAAVLILQTDDSDQPELRVPVTARGVDLGPCQLELHPASFGTVPLGRHLDRALRISNRGAVDCLVSTASGLSEDFVLESPNAPSLRVPAGGDGFITVRFAPRSVSDRQASLLVNVSDPAEPLRSVPLTGRGELIELFVTPRHLDFGRRDTACTRGTHTVHIVNHSSMIATVLDHGIDPIASFTTATLTGMQVSAHSALPITVELDPTSPGEHRADLWIDLEVGGQSHRYHLDLRAHSEAGGQTVDRFRQLGNRKVDLLFVVDFGGTSSALDALSTYASPMFSRAAALGVDYRVAITTSNAGTDDGGFLPANAPADRILDPSRGPSVAADFVAALSSRSRGARAGDDQGLEASLSALDFASRTSTNAGWLRPDAAKTILFISDESDASPLPPIVYADLFTELADAQPATLHGWLGPLPSGCQSADILANAGLGYAAAISRTAGQSESICANPGQAALDSLVGAMFGLRTSFPLSQVPEESTLEVRVDGADVPRQSAAGGELWLYDPGARALSFSLYGAPAPGSEIEIQYRARCP